MKKIYHLYLLSFALLLSCHPEGPKIKNSVAPLKDENTEVKEEAGTGEKAYKACNLKNLGIASELGSPKSIEEAIVLINALPRPLDIPCFISALNRPLNINISNSTLSIQPAVDNGSPRVFIMNMALTISISISGPGSYIMEFAESTGSLRSIKGELKFPIQSGDVNLNAPFERINVGGKTSCNGCHRNEEISTSRYSGIAYESIAIKPSALSKVLVYDFQNEVYRCDQVLKPNYRCNLIYAIFNQGKVQHLDFPSAIPTFFESLRP